MVEMQCHHASMIVGCQKNNVKLKHKNKSIILPAQLGVPDTICFWWNGGMRDQAFQVALIPTVSTPGFTPRWHTNDIWCKIHHCMAPKTGACMSLSTRIQKNTTLVEYQGYCECKAGEGHLEGGGWGQGYVYCGHGSGGGAWRMYQWREFGE